MVAGSPTTRTRSNSTLTKDAQAMISYKLFSYSEALGPIISKIQGPFNMMTLLELEQGAKGQIQHLQKI